MMTDCYPKLARQHITSKQQHRGTNVRGHFNNDVRVLYALRDFYTFLAIAKLLKRWWPGTESNRRRRPFQGRALPTELPGHSLGQDGVVYGVRQTSVNVRARYKKSLT